eukprot:gene13744-16212_t
MSQFPSSSTSQAKVSAGSRPLPQTPTTPLPSSTTPKSPPPPLKPRAFSKPPAGTLPSTPTPTAAASGSSSPTTTTTTSQVNTTTTTAPQPTTTTASQVTTAQQQQKVVPPPALPRRDYTGPPPSSPPQPIRSSGGNVPLPNNAASSAPMTTSPLASSYNKGSSPAVAAPPPVLLSASLANTSSGSLGESDTTPAPLTSSSSSSSITFEKHSVQRHNTSSSISTSHNGEDSPSSLMSSTSSMSSPTRPLAHSNISTSHNGEDHDDDKDGHSEESRKSIFKKFPHQWAIGKLEKDNPGKEKERERKEIEKKEEKERKDAEKREKKERKEREKLEKTKEKEKEKGDKTAAKPAADTKEHVKERILSRTSSSIASKLKNATLKRDHGDDSYSNTSPMMGGNSGSPVIGSSSATGSSLHLGHSPILSSSPDSPYLGSSPPLSAGESSRSATQLETSRGLMTWGSASNSKLGFKVETREQSQNTPERLPNFNVSDICSISCGSYYSAALTENGDVYMWGRGSVKNPPLPTLGTTTLEDQMLPTKVESLSEIVLISIGFYHSAAVKSNGELLTWGCGEDGQLGHGDVLNQALPRVVQSITSHWVTQVQCGEKHTICLTKNGKVFTWGTSEYGQLGLGDTQKNCTPMLVTSLEKHHIIQIACGSTHCAVLTNHREVLVFGNGAAMGSANIISLPMMVPSLKALNIERLSCGHYSTAALTECGDVYTWGNGQECGHGTNQSESSPKLVEALRSQSIRMISCGGRHMAFLTDSGRIYTCGKDPFGQLGHAAGDQNKPRKIEALLKTTFMAISCGENHNTALFDTTRSFRDKFCWKLLESQRTLVRSLNIIRGIFLNPLLVRDREQLPESMKHLPYIFLSEEEIRTIFGQIERVYAANSSTLHLMSARLAAWSNKRKVGDILLNHVKGYEAVFSAYCEHLPFAIYSLDQMLKKPSAPINAYLKECERLANERRKQETDDDARESFGLRSLLLEPLQVMARYHKGIAGMVKYTKPTHIDYQGLVDLEVMIEEKLGKVGTIITLVNNPAMLATYIASQTNPPSSASDDSSSFLKEYDAKIESLQNFRKTCLKLVKSSKKYYEVEPEAFKEQGHFSEHLVSAKTSLETCVDSQLSASLDHFSGSIKKIGYLRSELSTRTNSAFAQPLNAVADDLESFLPLIIEMRKRVFDAHTEYDSAVNRLYSLAKNVQPSDRKLADAERDASNLKKALDLTVVNFDTIFKEGVAIQTKSLKLFYACMKAQQEYFERGLQRFHAMKPSFDALDSHFRQQSRAAWSKSIHETLTTTFSADKSTGNTVSQADKVAITAHSAPAVVATPSPSSSFLAPVDVVSTSPSNSSSFIMSPDTTNDDPKGTSSLSLGKATGASPGLIDPHVIMAELESTNWGFILDPPTANEFTETFIEEQYDTLVELLASPSLQVVQCVVSPCSQDEQARTIDSISRIFDSFNKIRPIIHTGIEGEVQSTANPSTLFRSNTTATKLMTAFTKMRGMPYLTKIITPLVREIVDSPAGYEVDPSKINEGSEELMTNMMNLIQMSEKFTDTIIDSLHQLPLSLREISKYLQREVVSKFPDNKHSSVGGFIFLRFLCPAIIAPFTAGLVDEAPGPEATRALVLIGKVLQNLANGIEFGQKESFMIPVNRFIIGNLTRLNDYFDKLTDVPDYKSDMVALSSKEQVQKDIRNIHLLIVKNLSKVIKQLALYRQKDIIGQLSKTLVFLGDPSALYK